jgi:hydroxyacylglutathione hydrolase
MLLRPFLNDATSCASYLFGCTSHGTLAVVDPHVGLVDRYLATADEIGHPIVAVFETHVQADHVSGLPELVERTGAPAYLPADAGVEFKHAALADGDVVELGNTRVRALATLPRLRSAPRHRRAVARIHGRLAVDRGCRTTRPACRR